MAFSATAGIGTPLVLLHGRARCKAEFRHLMASSIGEERTVIAIDLPGHGGSGAASDPDHTYTIEGYSDAVIEVLEHLGIERAGVLGRSIGAHVGLQMARAFPGFAGLFVESDDGAADPSHFGARVAPTRNLPGGRRGSRRAHRRRDRLPTKDEALGPALHLVSTSDDRYRRLSPTDSAPTMADLAAVRHAIGADRPFMRSCRTHTSLLAGTRDAGNEAPFEVSGEPLLCFLSQVDRVSLDVSLLGLCLSG
ncbi:alpha/beta fold hydrolase [Lichenibacterium minor]|nr:alpha/beta hydrolase [Lichenibacterium minor]